MIKKIIIIFRKTFVKILYIKKSQYQFNNLNLCFSEEYILPVRHLPENGLWMIMVTAQLGYRIVVIYGDLHRAIVRALSRSTSPIRDLFVEHCFFRVGVTID